MHLPILGNFPLIGEFPLLLLPQGTIKEIEMNIKIIFFLILLVFPTEQTIKHRV
jgi:hypothetical protein